MDVWDESNERRSPSLSPSRRIRRFHDWKDFSLFVVQIVGGVVVAGGMIVGLLTSMGFTFSGSGAAIAKIQKDDVVRDTTIAKLQRQSDFFSSRLDDIVYLVCEQAKRNQPGIILPRSCK